MATPIVTIPITVQYLGSEIYGLWATISSIIGMLVFADLGLGNGLITRLGQAYTNSDIAGCQRLISTVTTILFGVAGLALLLLAISYPWIPWEQLLNTQSSEARNSARAIVLVQAVCFIINLPLTVVQRAQMAIQQGYNSNIWLCAGSLMGICAVFLGKTLRLSPPMFIFLIAFAPVLSAWGNWVWFFLYSQPNLSPSLGVARLHDAKVLLKVGTGFLLLSSVSCLGIYADNFIIAQTCGLEAVTKYSIPAKVAAILTTVVAIVCTPMWAANSEAFARGDVGWVRKNTRRLVYVSVTFTFLAAVVFCLLGPLGLRVWLGVNFEPSLLLLSGLGIQAVAISAASPCFMLLNAAEVVLPQLRIFLIFTPISVLMKIVAVRSIGLDYLPWAGTLCYLVIVIPLVIRLAKKTLERFERIIG